MYWIYSQVMCSQITFGDLRFHNTQVFCCWFFMFSQKFCLCILLCGLCLCVLGLDSCYLQVNCVLNYQKIWSSYVVLQLDLVCWGISFGLGCVFCMRFCMTNVVKISFCFNMFVVLSSYLCKHSKNLQLGKSCNYGGFLGLLLELKRFCRQIYYILDCFWFKNSFGSWT